MILPHFSTTSVPPMLCVLPSDYRWKPLTFALFPQVIIGHDWGSFIAARFVLWHPQRVLAVAQ